MPKHDPRIDKIVQNSSFAKPILAYVRKAVYQAYPKATETLKWGLPFFMQEDKILCAMPVFKAYCRFGFWRGQKIKDAKGNRVNMGITKLRVESTKDLPPFSTLVNYLKQAVRNNQETPAKKIKKKLAAPKKIAPKAPIFFLQALKSNPSALKTYEAFSPSAKRDYITWLLDAKTDETRARRLEQAVDWISEGKRRNWKYEKA